MAFICRILYDLPGPNLFFNLLCYHFISTVLENCVFTFHCLAFCTCCSLPRMTYLPLSTPLYPSVLSLVVTYFSCHFFPGPPSMGQEPSSGVPFLNYLFRCVISPIYLSTHPHHFAHMQVVEQGSANLFSQGPDSKYF